VVVAGREQRFDAGAPRLLVLLAVGLLADACRLRVMRLGLAESSLFPPEARHTFFGQNWLSHSLVDLYLPNRPPRLEAWRAISLYQTNHSSGITQTIVVTIQFSRY